VLNMSMTLQDQSIADDRMRGEIAVLLAETRQISVNTFLASALAAAALIAGTAALVRLFFQGGRVHVHTHQSNTKPHGRIARLMLHLVA